MQQRAEDLGERMMKAHGDFAGGDGRLPEALGHMGAITFEQGGAQGRPEQSLGDVGLRGFEGVEIGVTLPLFEHEFHLPAQSIGIADLFGGKLRAREVGQEVARSFLLGVPSHDQAPLKLPLPNDIEVKRLVVRHLGLHALERLVPETFDLPAVCGVGMANRGIERAFGLDDKVAPADCDLAEISQRYSLMKKARSPRNNPPLSV